VSGNGPFARIHPDDVEPRHALLGEVRLVGES
jgi:hypothetical protein